MDGEERVVRVSGDKWLSDARIRKLSPAARSLLFDILCCTEPTQEGGVVHVDGPELFRTETVAQAVGRADVDEVARELQELLRSGMVKWSKDDTQLIVYDVDTIVWMPSTDLIKASDNVPNPKKQDPSEVLDFYLTFHPRARPGHKERQLILDRLKDGYSVSDLCVAIEGNHISPWHCGENPRGTKYHKLSLIMRDSEQVSSFMEIAMEMQEGSTEVSRHNKRILDTYLNSTGVGHELEQ